MVMAAKWQIEHNNIIDMDALNLRVTEHYCSCDTGDEKNQRLAKNKKARRYR
jgi:hypothetical protein